jgi:hypothetical protein
MITPLSSLSSTITNLEGLHHEPLVTPPAHEPCKQLAAHSAKSTTSAARTEQTACKSTGDKDPRKQLDAESTGTSTLMVHTGQMPASPLVAKSSSCELPLFSPATLLSYSWYYSRPQDRSPFPIHSAMIHGVPLKPNNDPTSPLLPLLVCCLSLPDHQLSSPSIVPIDDTSSCFRLPQDPFYHLMRVFRQFMVFVTLSGLL